MYVCIEANLGINKTKLLDQLEAAHLDSVKKLPSGENDPVLPTIKFCKLPSLFETALCGSGGLSDSLADKMMTYVTLLIKLLDETTVGKVDIVITDYSLISIRHHVCTMKNMGYMGNLAADGILKVIDAHTDYLKPDYLIFMDFDFDTRLPCTVATKGGKTFSYPSSLYFETYEALLYKFICRWLTSADDYTFYSPRTGIVNDAKQLEDDMFIKSLLTQIYNKL